MGIVWLRWATRKMATFRRLLLSPSTPRGRKLVKSLSWPQPSIQSPRAMEHLKNSLSWVRSIKYSSQWKKRARLSGARLTTGVESITMTADTQALVSSASTLYKNPTVSIAPWNKLCQNYPIRAAWILTIVRAYHFVWWRVSATAGRPTAWYLRKTIMTSCGPYGATFIALMNRKNSLR